MAGLAAHVDGRRHPPGHLLGGHHRGIGRLLNLSQDVPHLGRGFLGLVGQVLDLAGHHRETLAVLAGPGRFDGRIQRQQIGLFRDIVDRGDDFPDGLGAVGQHQDVLRRGPGLFLESVQRRHRVLDSLASGLANLQGAVYGVADVLGPLRRLVGGLRHFRDGGDRLGDGSRLGLGA